ncbi:AMP-binding protein [Rhodococcus wratislaviensis]|uniref:Putative acid--CoA ligase n=1 Tax=Rhodococcus wratislaviensis NBRC 100605 TaxID=1219028 RepID=X0PYT6_RHOWR|nr:AMP-binding protein [Rhodococcus wratislaviensis]GAF43592.1 putative acid--CoA ligase [Rhodococcus wratislaviensis NBRC 100605]
MTAPTTPALTTTALAALVSEYGSIGRLLERRADERGDAPFVRFDGRDFSFLEMDAISTAVANALHARGLALGDRIALMTGNSPQMLALWLGAAKLGVVTVFVNTALKGEGLAYVLRDAQPQILVIDEDLAPRLAVLDAAEMPPEVLVGQDHDLHEGSRLRTATADLGPDTPCSILYTSGTTGPPKGCLLPHGQYLAAAFLHADNCKFGPDTTVYCCMPLFHIAAQNYSMLSALVAGGTFALDERFSASRFWSRIADTGATAFNFVGAMAVHLWNRPVDPVERAHPPLVGFGAPVPVEIWGEWEQRFDTVLLQAFGMTENALPVLVRRDEAPVAPGHRGTAGRETVAAQVQVVDDDGHPTTPGTVGEIVTRPRIPWTTMTEYVGRPDAMREAFRNSWFHTGDLGRLDADGHLYYVDRKKDALRRRGEMVSSWELETLIGRYPGVADCAVVGIASDVTEDDILVAVVCDGDPIDPAALITYCSERTARFQVPRYVRIVRELPRTQTQRIEKYRLRAEGVTPDTWDAMAPQTTGQ